MPRHRAAEEEYEGHGVHRRRYQRTSSTVPILIGGVVVVGVILVFAILSLTSKEDPEARKAAIRAAAERFLVAAIAGDRKKIFESINPVGGDGWMTKNHNIESVRKYRFYKEIQDPAQRAEAEAFRVEQNERMFTEIKNFPVKLGIKDITEVKQVLEGSGISTQYSKVTLRIANKGGQGTLILSKEGKDWIVENWTVDVDAPHR